MVALSDTHGRHDRFRNLPPADVFLHAGDFTRYGSGAEEFALWFHRLPYALKLLTLGNHEQRDATFPHSIDQWRALFGPMLLLDRGARASVGGREITVFGVPDATRLREIPDGVDIVLSHHPPYRVLDETRGGGHAGSESIAALLEPVRPPFHVFGHVHAQGGKTLALGATTHVNAATRAVVFQLP